MRHRSETDVPDLTWRSRSPRILVEGTGTTTKKSIIWPGHSVRKAPKGEISPRRDWQERNINSAFLNEENRRFVKSSHGTCPPPFRLSYVNEFATDCSFDRFPWHFFRANASANFCTILWSCFFKKKAFCLHSSHSGPSPRNKTLAYQCMSRFSFHP